MNKNIFAGIGMLIVLSGCASSRQPSALNQLQIQVSQMEYAMDAKDQEIRELKYEVDRLSGEVEQLQEKRPALAQRPSLPGPGTLKGPESSAAPKREKGIIRVNVSPKEVQRALQSAGFYDGPIDGKLGPKSQQAIRDFQAGHDLADDGVVGQKTWAKLKEYAGLDEAGPPAAVQSQLQMAVQASEE